MAAKFRLMAGVAAIGLAAAAGLTIYWFGLEEKPTVSRVTTVAQRNRLEPPFWSPDGRVPLKEEAEQLFLKGMDAYLRRDYPEASNSLYQAATLAPESAEVHFFLGVAYLMTRDTIAGIRELKTVTGLGRGPYEPQARLHLGETLIERGDAAGAREYLAPVAADKGSLGEQARALIGASYPRVGND